MILTPTGISLHNLTFQENDHLILNDVAFEAPQGEITCLFGPSGAGKTTCLRLIAGLEQAKSGRILYQNQPLHNSQQGTDSPQGRIGFCFQDDGLWPGLRVDEHLRIVLNSLALSKEQREEKIQTTLERFHLDPIAKQYPDQLSGGEQKRVAFARAMVMEPRILLLDEPLASVEGQLRQELGELIVATRAPERVVIFVSHHLQEALALSDRLVILYDGKVLREGSTQEVYHNPKINPVARLMGYHNFYDLKREDHKVVSPFGEVQDLEWSTHSTEVQAASLIEDLEAVPTDEGKGSVQYCRLLGRRYLVQVQWNQQTFLAYSQDFIPQEQPVTLYLKNAPAILETHS